MNERAYMVREIRIPVPAPLSFKAAAYIPMNVQIEYLVLEQWSDWTMRHPTTGNVVAMELWAKNQAAALRFLRTGER